MRHVTTKRNMPHRYRGFTLVEVLVAIIILLVGVVAALKIFPGGFDAFTESQQTYTALKLVGKWANDFQENPDVMLDGIYPVAVPPQPAPETPSFLDDLLPVDFQTAANGEDGLLWNLYTLATLKTGYDDTKPVSDTNPTIAYAPAWPLWQPRSVRALRRVVGERCVIPAEFSRSTSFVPKYFPRFAPAMVGGHWDQVNKIYQVDRVPVDPKDPAGASVYNPLMIYDLRYRKVSLQQLRYQAKPNHAGILRGAILFTPAGSPTYNDLHAVAFTGDNPVRYIVEIDGKDGNGKDTIRWKNDAAPDPADWADPNVWIKQGVTIDPGTEMALTDTQGNTLTVTFDGDTGHLTGDRWEFTAENPSDNLVYAIDYRPQAGRPFLVFLPSLEDRWIRLTFQYLVDGSDEIKTYTAPAGIRLPASPNLANYVSLTFADLPDLADDPAKMIAIPGSEQVNRAYEFVDVMAAATNNYTDWYPDPTIISQKLQELRSGCYAVVSRMQYLTQDDIMLTGPVFFSRADAGRTVKIDYTVADWSILHDDLTVDKDGGLTLSVPDPKIRDLPVYPREPHTWGLFRPMADKQVNPVMELVDMRTGMAYQVVTTDPTKRSPTYTLEPLQKPAVRVPEVLARVDLGEAQQGRLRVGGITVTVNGRDIPGIWSGTWDKGFDYRTNHVVVWGGTEYLCIQDHTSDAGNAPGTGGGSAYWRVANARTNWRAMDGMKLRVFYRARRDWTLQVFKAPSVFSMMQDASVNAMDLRSPANAADLTLNWDQFWGSVSAPHPDDRQWIAVPGIFAGQTLAVDYYRRDELFRLAADVNNSTVVKVAGDDTNYRDAWQSGQNYLSGDVVMEAGSYYRCLKGHTSTTDDNPATGKNRRQYWTSDYWANDVNAGMLIRIYRRTGAPIDVYVAGAPDVTNKQVVLDDGITAEADAVAANLKSPLRRVSGETHIVPVPVQDSTSGKNKRISMVRLRTAPEWNTEVGVRGVSVTIRALWVQPRAGKAYSYVSGSAPEFRSMNERWQAKSMTIIPPISKD